MVSDEPLQIHSSTPSEKESGLTAESFLDILWNFKSGLIPRHEPEAQECESVPFDNLTFRSVDPKFQLLFDKANYRVKDSLGCLLTPDKDDTVIRITAKAMSTLFQFHIHFIQQNV